MSDDGGGGGGGSGGNDTHSDPTWFGCTINNMLKHLLTQCNHNWTAYNSVVNELMQFNGIPIAF